MRFRVVLQKVREYEIRVERIRQIELPKPLNERTLSQPAEVLLEVDSRLPHAPSIGVAQSVLLLEQPPVIERPEPSGVRELKQTVTACLDFPPEAVEAILPYRQRDALGDFERARQELVGRYPVNGESVAGLELKIDRNPRETLRL